MKRKLVLVTVIASMIVSGLTTITDWTIHRQSLRCLQITENTARA